MKRMFLLMALLMFGGVVFAEEPFKIIVLPLVNNTTADITVIQKLFADSKSKMYIDIINKATTEKINQKFCQPKYLQAEAVCNQNDQYVDVLPEKEFMIKMVKESKADGIFAFEMTKLTVGRYGGSTAKLNCVASCHVRSYNLKTNKYVDGNFEYIGDNFRMPPFGDATKKFDEVITDAVGGAIDKAFDKLPY